MITPPFAMPADVQGQGQRDGLDALLADGGLGQGRLVVVEGRRRGKDDCGRAGQVERAATGPSRTRSPRRTGLAAPRSKAQLGETGVAGNREQLQQLAPARLAGEVVQHLVGRVGQHKTGRDGEYLGGQGGLVVVDGGRRDDLEGRAGEEALPVCGRQQRLARARC